MLFSVVDCICFMEYTSIDARALTYVRDQQPQDPTDLRNLDCLEDSYCLAMLQPLLLSSDFLIFHL